MDDIRDCASSILRWRRESFLHPRYRLEAGPKVAATLHWRSGLSRKAIAQCAEASWEFAHYKDGLDFTAVDLESGWAYPTSYSRGVGAMSFSITLPPNGLTFPLRPEGTRNWRFGGGDIPHKDIEGCQLDFDPKGSLAIQPGAVASRDLALLACLGWYLIRERIPERVHVG